MHGGEGEERKRGSRHMWTGPTLGNSSLVLASPSSPRHVSPSSSPNSFFKDGRKISVGDCALFKPSQDSPPFIGIIRWLTTGKEHKLKLGVNWLYRPAEVKLGKGILLEAAPNEIFYSFHKDEIPAASLLHPCKVAFLPKGVELPAGICSFVCRRVYDITHSCLWWLTDQDYINERQEEVDQLLYKTSIEMHATVSGGRSPKPMNGPSSTSQLKPGSDSVQNTPTSFSSHAKGKKRERGEQASEPIKRERSTKMDDGDSGHGRVESILRSEIAKFTEKGGLVDSEGVEKLVQLMLPERNERKIDLVGRSMLSGVVAATDKFDCLNQFVLRGLPIFDEWLQEVHKGKIGDGSGSKDGDKHIEDFLLVLLRALDKLPVNLHALQMCNIGKSVNHLRTHKNVEIQKKARSLVDTWKKRVEAEIDAKAGPNQAVPWSARSRLPEVSHAGNRHSGVSSEVATKSSVVQLPASKAAPVKLVQGETLVRSASTSPGSVKSAVSPASVGNNLKEGQPRNTGASGVSDLPVTSMRDEKSSSSSQSHNNSQSCSSDHAKTGGLFGKEDARSSTAGSVNATKGIGVSSRHRKSANGFPGPALSGVQRETGSSRGSSLHRNAASEKLSQSSLTCEKAVDIQVTEANNQKLIVKIPNRGRSPAQSASVGSFEDPSVMNSRASSPVLLEKHEQSDRDVKEKNDPSRANLSSDVNNESWQSNDFKEALTGSDEGDGSPATVPEEERLTGEDARKLAEVSKAASSSGNERISGKLREASFGSINALIESVKYCEANASIAAGDDIGMNLLASVAAGEMSKSDTMSPTASPCRNTPPVEHSCTGSDSRVKSPGDDLAQNLGQSVDATDEGHETRGINSGSCLTRISDDKTISCSQEKSRWECNGNTSSCTVDVRQTTERCITSDVKVEEASTAAPVGVTCANIMGKPSNDGDRELLEEKAGCRLNSDGTTDTKGQLHYSFSGKERFGVSGAEMTAKAADRSLSSPSSETGGEDERNEKEECSAPELKKGTDGVALLPSGSSKGMASENVEEVKAEKADETDGRSQSTEKRKTDKESNSGSVVVNLKSESVQDIQNAHEVNEQHVTGSASRSASPAFVQEPEPLVRSKESRLTVTEADETEECTSAAADAASSALGGSEMEAKVEFDLNEGFMADDGRCGESNNLRATGSTAATQLISPLPLPASSVSTSLPASITVAAAAKKPFVPPEDLLKNRRELGWKGSAATSAFRPAEPRKAAEVPIPEAAPAKPTRAPLDFDLNVPDERVLEDLASRTSAHGVSCGSDLKKNPDLSRDEMMSSLYVRSSGGLDLDLNRVEEPADLGNHLMSNSHRAEVQIHPVKSSSGGLCNGEASSHRDFDLNDGPLIDEGGAEPSPFVQTKNTAPSQPSVSGLRLNNTEMGNFSSWFNQGNPYQTVAIQSILPDRGDQSFPIVAPAGPQRMLAPPSGSTPFSPDVYRGPVLSSSPAVSFPSTPYQYPVFPFGTNFPLPSGAFSGASTTYVDSPSGGRLCFPAVHSQVLAPAGALPSHFPRPGSYVVSLPDSNNNGGVDSSAKWGRQGLDLNAGPIGPDTESRDEASSLTSRQLSVASSQVLAEQARMYRMAGTSVLKRKEPEGGWEGYKQSSWQ